MRNSFYVTTVLVAGLFANTVSAQGLKEEADVRNGLLIVGMAYELSENCDSIDARTFRGIQALLNLKSVARSLGYSNAEIDNYVDDKVEKKRLEGIAKSQLVQLGVVPGDPASYCTVGRDQIAKGTGVGRLLR